MSISQSPDQKIPILLNLSLRKLLNIFKICDSFKNVAQSDLPCKKPNLRYLIK